MSDPLFFQSAGRRDLKFWGEDDGPTDLAWERLSDRSRSSGGKKGQVEGLGGLAKTQKIENSNLHGFELHRPSSKGTKLLLQVIKAIINQ